MITSLTSEQKARFPEFVEKWTRIGLCPDRADRPTAERGIAAAYAAANLNAPHIVWCGSPLSQGLTRAIVMSVGDSVRDSVRASVWASVGASVWASVRASVRDSVGDSVWASVGDSVRDSVGDSVGDSVWASVWASGYGQHDASWIGFYDYFGSACGLVEQTSKLQGLSLICGSAGWFLPHAKVCWVCERHNILNRDNQGRLHCVNGPAVAYPDGWEIYAVHGVRVPRHVIREPQQMTVAQIVKEQNVEIRRVMVERFGQERYLKESGAKEIHRDDFGTLYRAELPNDEPIVMVKVVNSTPEPTGEFKDYFLRVPPDMKRAKEAVAWGFGMKEHEYQPAAQT